PGRRLRTTRTSSTAGTRKATKRLRASAPGRGRSGPGSSDTLAEVGCCFPGAYAVLAPREAQAQCMLRAARALPEAAAVLLACATSPWTEPCKLCKLITGSAWAARRLRRMHAAAASSSGELIGGRRALELHAARRDRARERRRGGLYGRCAAPRPLIARLLRAAAAACTGTASRAPGAAARVAGIAARTSAVTARAG